MEKTVEEKLKSSLNKYAQKQSLKYFSKEKLPADVFYSKYLLRDNNDMPLEFTPDDMHKRIAAELYRIELKKFKNPLSFDEIYCYLKNFKKIIPQGSPMFGIGNKYQYITLSNCYVGHSPKDSYGGIHQTDQELTQISKRRGGFGLDISHIRPAGTTVRNSSKTATGIIPFMERYSNSIREVGQCIEGNQRVKTEHGVKKIKNVVPLDKVWTKIGWVNVRNVLNNGLKEVYRVTTETGYSITTSLDHIYQSFDENGKLLESRLSDMNIGSNIVLSIGNGSYDNKNTKLIKSNYKNINNKPDNCVLPEDIDEELAYLLGYSYGDGYVSETEYGNNGLHLACSNDYEQIKTKLRNICFLKFKYLPKITSGDGDLENIDINNKAIIEFLNVDGLLKQHSSDIMFPDRVLYANPDIQIAFLSGYFDADGDIASQKGGYRFRSTSKQFLQNVQVILSCLGVASKLSNEDRSENGWRTLYTVCVVGKKSTKRFKELFQYSEKVRLKPYESKRDCWLTPFKAKTFNVSHNQYSYCPDNTQYLSLSVVDKLAINNKHICTNLLQDKIALIEYIGQEETYDIQLDEEHLFWCEGLYVHNSGRRGALMITIDIHHPESVILIDDEEKAKQITINPNMEHLGVSQIDTTTAVYNPDNLDFCSVKLDRTKVTGANISIRFSDEFFNAVKNGTTYQQRWPVDSPNPEIIKNVDARKVWAKIIKCAWLSAEPGILFWDNILRESIPDCYTEHGFKTISTNPCCFAKDSDVFVITNNGIKEIKNVNDKDLIWVQEHQVWANTSGYFNSGIAETYLVKFSNGTELVITGNHKLCKIKEKRAGTKKFVSEGELVELKNLQIGDKIHLNNKPVDAIGFGKLGTYDEGLILGAMTGDGCLSYSDDSSKYPNTILDFWKDDYIAGKACEKAINNIGFKNTLFLADKEIEKHRIKNELFTEYFTNKYEYNIWLFKSEDKLNPFLFNATRDFVVGYLKTYFACDGTVAFDTDNSNYNIQLSSINKNRLKQVQVLLGLFGITSSFGLGKPAGETEIKGKLYNTKDSWRITISGINNIRNFRDNIGIEHDSKNNQLQKICCLPEQKKQKCQEYTKIVSITPVGQKEVGCINIPNYGKFTANGLISGNSEIPLSILDSCRLLLQNLLAYVKNAFLPNAYFDYVSFFKEAKIAQRFIDNIIDLEIEKIDGIINKIQQDPESKELKVVELEMWQTIREMCLKGRRTGTGLTALADTLAALNIGYGTPESLEEVDKIYKCFKFACYQSSIDMAKEIGPFPVWNHEAEKNNTYLNRFREEDVYFENPETKEVLYVKGLDLYNEMSIYGRRNIALLTSAPAGSCSILAWAGEELEKHVSNKFLRQLYGTSSGIEPVYELESIRRKKVNHNEGVKNYDFKDQNGDLWVEYSVYHPTVRYWMSQTKKTDVKESPWYGYCSSDINWTARVKLQSVAQKHIDHAISSTINLPNNVEEEEVAKIYEKAWETGCKGMTVYRNGCRTGVIVDKSEKSAKIQKTQAPKRLRHLLCDIHHITVNKTNFLVVVGLISGEPYEVFAAKTDKISKRAKSGDIERLSRGVYRLVADNGTVIESLTDLCQDEEEALTRMVSTALRHGAQIDFVVSQLERTKGNLMSFSKCLARALKKYIKDGANVHGEECQSCGGRLVREGGCKICTQCGSSTCN